MVSPLSFLPLLPLLFSIVGCTVPESETFRFVNEGEFINDLAAEYNANFRILKTSSYPFMLCFYNTTPNAFTLALNMGNVPSESIFRWVWEANRGNPVRENATLTFGSNGNLVLADADGRIAWETATANKGVTGLDILPSGNMVLHDARGRYIWQSFDHPTDTVLVGQTLRVGSELVSRASDEENVDGSYRFVVEKKRLAMYCETNNTPKPQLYYAGSEWFQDGIENVTFVADMGLSEEGYATSLYWSPGSGSQLAARPKYNATLSFFRVGSDGNARIFTFNNIVPWGAWEMAYALFSRGFWEVEECQLPSRCGEFGLCEENQCVACPTPNGLSGWSPSCRQPELPPCDPGKFYYYKLEGVDHFLSRYTSGTQVTKVDDCGKKCTGDCKCLGYFYHQVTQKCWLGYELRTLTKVQNSTHLGFIKASIAKRSP